MKAFSTPVTAPTFPEHQFWRMLSNRPATFHALTPIGPVPPTPSATLPTLPIPSSHTCTHVHQDVCTYARQPCPAHTFARPTPPMFSPSMHACTHTLHLRTLSYPVLTHTLACSAHNSHPHPCTHTITEADFNFNTLQRYFYYSCQEWVLCPN